MAAKFGIAIVPYLTSIHASSGAELHQIIDEACRDAEVVANYLLNQSIVRDDGDSYFRSAFKVKLPIPPEAIRRAYLADMDKRTLYYEYEKSMIPPEYQHYL